MATNYTPTDAKNDIKDAARETAGDVNRGVNRLADDAKSAYDNATSSGAVQDAKNRAQDLASDAKHKAQNIAETARERGEEIAENVKSEATRLYRAGERRAGELAEHAEDYYDEFSDQVRRHPAASLGIAAGVGFLIGLILARR